ncbi:hypothetical protein SFUMM280S_09064 [Streptomyces fumanus]
MSEDSTERASGSGFAGSAAGLTGQLPPSTKMLSGDGADGVPRPGLKDVTVEARGNPMGAGGGAMGREAPPRPPKGWSGPGGGFFGTSTGASGKRPTTIFSFSPEPSRWALRPSRWERTPPTPPARAVAAVVVNSPVVRRL